MINTNKIWQIWLWRQISKLVEIELVKTTAIEDTIAKFNRDEEIETKEILSKIPTIDDLKTSKCEVKSGILDKHEPTKKSTEIISETIELNHENTNTSEEFSNVTFSESYAREVEEGK